MSFRLLLLGSPAVEHAGAPSALPFERRSQLVALLALKRAWVGRAELAAMLWPEQDAKAAYANLRKILFRLQSLSWAPRIDVQAGALRLDASTDVASFELALRERRIADALSLWRGPLLAGFDDDSSEAWTSWLRFERERLQAAWRSAALERLAADIAPAEGIELSSRLLGIDPLDEAALHAHMDWLARGGQAGRARNAYREFAQRLAQELGLAPAVELKALHDSLGTAAAPQVPLATTVVAARDEGFIGRTVELRRIATRLSQDGCRLLSIVGPGGVGKTRLARRAMADLARDYTDGAVFVALDDVASAAGLGARLARETGVALSGSGDPLDKVIDVLRTRSMLVVLDNFEQLAGEAAIVDKLLAGCPQLQLIVTSRVRLALASEYVLPLEGLPCPDAEDADCVEAFDAARLFIQTARRVEPALVPSAEAAAIIAICRHVEGLPLALELAATWTRVLPCEAIAAELQQGTELLQAVDASRPARHASIDIVFDQSWRLLSDVERNALARLSVFRGGFSAEAARAVAGAALPVLGALADKSLLRKADGRIFLHPLVQQLAALRLGDGELRASTEAAHASYFDRLLVQRRRAVENGDRDALQQLDTEWENCRSAWRWSTAHASAAALAQSAPTLLHFCDLRGRFDEGLSLFGAALESHAASSDPRVSALLLGAVAHFEYRLDRYSAAEATATRGLAAARDARDAATQAQCLQVLGTCAFRRGRYDDARRFYKLALGQALASSDPRKAAVMLFNRAVVEKATGRYDEALQLTLETLAQHRRLGDVAGEALSLNSLGLLYLTKSDYESAAVHLNAGLALCDRHGFVGTRGFILANLTELAMKSGDDASALTYAKRALDTADSAGHRVVVAALKLHLARLALRRSDLAAARSELAAAMEIANAIGEPQLRLEGVACFAEILEAQKESDCARAVLAFAADHPLLNERERARLRGELEHLSPGADNPRRWPAIDLDELAHRIVVESSLAHAPLIAALRGAPRSTSIPAMDAARPLSR